MDDGIEGSMKTDRMKRINFMMDAATLEATDRLIAEVKKFGGKELSRSEVMRATCRAVEEAIRRMAMVLPVLQSGEELREALADWIIEAEQASQEFARIHTCTKAGRRA